MNNWRSKHHVSNWYLLKQFLGCHSHRAAFLPLRPRAPCCSSYCMQMYFALAIEYELGHISHGKLIRFCDGIQGPVVYTYSDGSLTFGCIHHFVGVSEYSCRRANYCRTWATANLCCTLTNLDASAA